MKVGSALLALGAILWTLGGCGGGGQEPFVPDKGSYSGTWTSTALSDSGTMALTVQADGTTTGTMTDVAQNATNGVVQGKVQDDGTFAGTIEIAGGSAAVTTGQLTTNSFGHLAGTLTEYVYGSDYALTVDLPKQ
jgi:hypothetical protein